MLGVLIFDTLPGPGDRHRRVAAAAALPRVASRTSPSSAACRGRHGQFADVASATRTTRRDPAVAVLRVESGLFFANADAVREAIVDHAAQPGTSAVILDAEAIAFVDVTAVRMLDELADDLARQGQQLVIAHDLGQVGDLLASEPDTALAVYPASTKRSPPSAPLVERPGRAGAHDRARRRRPDFLSTVEATAGRGSRWSRGVDVDGAQSP